VAVDSLVMAVVQWGSVSEWVSGIATSLALILALFLAVRQEIRENDGRLNAVYAWPEMHDGPDNASTWRIVVENGTTYPIYEWSIEISWVSPTDGKQIVETFGHEEGGIVIPGRNTFPDWEPSGSIPPSDSQVKVEVSFRNASDHLIRRLSTGKLVRS